MPSRHARRRDAAAQEPLAPELDDVQVGQRRHAAAAAPQRERRRALVLWWLSRRREGLHAASLLVLWLRCGFTSRLAVSVLDSTPRAVQRAKGSLPDPLCCDRWITAACELVKSKCRSLVTPAALRSWPSAVI